MKIVLNDFSQKVSAKLGFLVLNVISALRLPYLMKTYQSLNIVMVLDSFMIAIVDVIMVKPNLRQVKEMTL